MNKIKFLRNELHMTIRDLSKFIDFAPSTLTQYENESRDPGTHTIKNIANFFHVTIDYLLCHHDLGLYVYYENNNQRLVITESDYLRYKDLGFIYYIDNKRYIDANKKLDLPRSYDLSKLFDTLASYDDLESDLKNDTVNLPVPLKKSIVIKKIITLNDEKFKVIEKMLDVM